jgi:hypothetical protein
MSAFFAKIQERTTKGLTGALNEIKSMSRLSPERLPLTQTPQGVVNKNREREQPLPYFRLIMFQIAMMKSMRQRQTE